MFVIKTDLRKEPFSVDKVKKVISWAVGDYDLNPIVLESKFDQFIKDGISTAEIHENLIYHARMLASPEQPEWAFVAGRLLTMRLWKRNSIFEKTFHYYINEQMNHGLKNKAINKWTKNEIISLGEYIDQYRDLDHSYGSVLTAINKYLMPGECIQQMFMVNAMIIASIEPKETRLDFAKKVYDALSKRKISLATPWLSNLRAGKSISSCFIIQVGDSMESIADAWKDAALISKNGGGLGIDFSLIRANGSPIGSAPNASKGITSWVKIFNDIAVAVDQGGARAGAFTVHCPIWHKDIEDFLSIQKENGDFRTKSFDVFPQIGIHDLFMEEVSKEDGGWWYTFCPHELKLAGLKPLSGVYGKEFEANYKLAVTGYYANSLKNVQKYNAKELLKHVMHVQFETGVPYIAFLDRINERNPNNHEGFIPSVNLCTESYSNVEADKYSHVCNLASIVMGRMKDIAEIEETAALAAHILDNGIELTECPTPETKAHNKRYRTIGIGIQGLHDWVAKERWSWKDYAKFSELAEAIEYSAASKSVSLAAERGYYPAFEGSQWHTGALIHDMTKNGSTRDWKALQERINQHGIRNSQLTSPAPNTSSAPFMDATAGVMPVYRAFFNEDNSVGKFPVFGMYIKEFPLAYEQTQPRQNQSELSKLIGTLQNWIDTGISAEYIFDLNNPETKAGKLFDLIISAWKNNTKAIYYIRSIKKGSTIDDLMGGESICSACAG